MRPCAYKEGYTFHDFVVLYAVLTFTLAQVQTDLYTILGGVGSTERQGREESDSIRSSTRTLHLPSGAADGGLIDLEAPLLGDIFPHHPAAQEDDRGSSLSPSSTPPAPLAYHAPPSSVRTKSLCESLRLLQPLSPSARPRWTWRDWIRFWAIKHAMDVLLVRL